MSNAILTIRRIIDLNPENDLRTHVSKNVSRWKIHKKTQKHIMSKVQSFFNVTYTHMNMWHQSNVCMWILSYLICVLGIWTFFSPQTKLRFTLERWQIQYVYCPFSDSDMNIHSFHIFMFFIVQMKKDLHKPLLSAKSLCLEKKRFYFLKKDFRYVYNTIQYGILLFSIKRLSITWCTKATWYADFLIEF